MECQAAPGTFQQEFLTPSGCRSVRQRVAAVHHQVDVKNCCLVEDHTGVRDALGRAPPPQEAHAPGHPTGRSSGSESGPLLEACTVNPSACS
jgi:hypothetical protein